MQDKLKIFLDKIKLPEEMFCYFTNSKLVKLKLDHTRKNGIFFIETDKLLPTNVYDYIDDNISNSFKDLDTVKINYIINTDLNDENARDYFIYILNKTSLTKTQKIFYKNSEIEYVNNILTISVDNTFEKEKISRHTSEIIDLYNSIGFKINDVKYSIESPKILNEETTPIVKTITIKEDKTKNIFGEKITGKKINILDIIREEASVIVEVYVFGIDVFESAKTGFKILTLKISDGTDSMYAKLFSKDEKEFNKIVNNIKLNSYYKISGYVKNDQYAKDLVINIRAIESLDSKTNKRIDDAKEKRVELHTHTFMSQMDGVMSAEALIDEAISFGHKAIAITDHNGCQAFPSAFKKSKDIKILYGTELNVVDDEVDIVFRETDDILLDTTYVVFDVETTGFNAAGGDQIIEIGAVKIEKGNVIDRFSTLINPGYKVSSKTTEITGITDSMLKGKPSEEKSILDFKSWIMDLPLVAHNAKFDQSFLAMAYKKYNLGELKNTVLDTLELSRTLNPDWGRHGLTYLAKRYEIEWDEDAHHRADYDAEATAKIFYKMVKKLNSINIEKISDIKNLIPKDELHKQGDIFHVNLLCKNKEGLKNLFKIISLSNTKYLYKTPRILRSEINRLRSGILVGSSCMNGEVFREARRQGDDELANVMSFYDYIEIQPLSHYDILLQSSEFKDNNEIIDNIKKIIKVADISNIPVVATGDCHHLNKEDKIYREIIINQKVPGGGLHPLARNNINNIPSQHFLTTNEMLEEFSYLDKNKAKEIVITNTNKIADSIDQIKLIRHELKSPRLENSAEITKDLVYKKAKEIYGNKLPKLVEDRIEAELKGIIGGGFDVIYLIAQKLVKKSNEDGYIVGSRGSVGSSFVATMMDITEVNPLPPHYICPKCKEFIYEENNIPFSDNYSSGYDLPDRKCKCGTKFIKEGQNMPFATFLGFNADKVPDIDLNFSGENQSSIHDYTKELFGEDHVFRAGTIGTVADRTAFGFVKGYLEDKGIEKRSAEIERLALGCTGVKRTTGQHPGGIVVIPDYMDVFDFMPYQYPADDASSKWYTTHWDYHSVEDDLLKLDILGHDDPTILKMLQDISGIDIKSIPMDDKKVMKVFQGPEVLGVTKEQIMCNTGTLGLPELGTKFVKSMIEETKPTTFAELVKISGLSHGTDVWVGNVRDIINNKIVEFKDVIGCRDDIMTYLIGKGLEPLMAFKIMEFVRKGKPSQDKSTWKEFEEKMREKNIPEWYITSCSKIKYMFPKAHATAYIMMALRVAYFKVYYPIYYYASYFSVRCFDFEIERMIKGYNAIKEKLIEYEKLGYDISVKDADKQGVLELALEFTARGFNFKNIDLYKSEAKKFVIDDDGKSLIPPFITLSGLGDTVAYKIVEERQKGKFISKEDLQKRAKISSTLIDKMNLMKILDDLPESSQLSLF